jgi:hypothetical protein
MAGTAPSSPPSAPSHRPRASSRGSGLESFVLGNSKRRALERAVRRAPTGPWVGGPPVTCASRRDGRHGAPLTALRPVPQAPRLEPGLRARELCSREFEEESARARGERAPTGPWVGGRSVTCASRRDGGYGAQLTALRPVPQAPRLEPGLRARELCSRDPEEESARARGEESANRPVDRRSVRDLRESARWQVRRAAHRPPPRPTGPAPRAGLRARELCSRERNQQASRAAAS